MSPNETGWRGLLMKIKRLLRLQTWRNRLSIAIITLQMAVDKLLGKRVVILDLEEITLLPVLTPIIEQLLNSTDRISYYAAYKTTCPAVGNLVIPDKRTFHYSLSVHFPAADMYLSPHVYGNASLRTIKVHIPHGQPVKFACLPKKYFERYDVHFLTGPLDREQTEYTIAYYGLKKKITLYDIGMPKSDALMNGCYDRRSVLEDLRLDAARKTVIYAPSWEEGLSLRAFGHVLFDRLAELKNLNVIIRLHPTSLVPRSHPDFAFYTGGIDWGQIVQEYLRHPNIRFAPEGLTERLLAASDVMITDVSGVAWEFLSLVKPVIYLDCPDFFSKTLPTLYRDFGPNDVNTSRINEGRRVGHVVDSVDELPRAVRLLLNDPSYNIQERIEFAKQVQYHSGRASAEAARVIFELLHLEPNTPAWQ
ncbi:MAG: CDP-glycerol glycerophosphotransferase family protein [Chloroflexi bacterium]|nr:CDP-glycerol glycerophosphotransferase family protein [Chloroflexota bacterium]